MRLNSRFFAVILTLCMVTNLSLPASAAALEATYSEASYYDIATTTYSRMLMFQNGVVPAANSDKLYGLVDVTGKVVAPFQYAGMWSLGGGYFKVSDTGYNWGGNQGIIDSTGKVVRAMSECSIYTNGDTICIESGSWENRKHECFDFSMNPVAHSEEQESGSTPSALAGYDYYWRSGNYYYVTEYTDGGSRSGLLDANYNVVFPLGQYTYVDVISTAEGTVFLAGTENGKTLLNENKETVVPAGTYDSMERNRYSDDFLAVTSGDKTGAISITGKVLVPLGEYDEITGMNKDGYIAAVSYDGSPWGGELTNIVSKLFKDGKEVKTFNGKRVATEVYYRDLAFSTTGELNGMMDMNGKVILEEKYASIVGAYENGAYTGDLITRLDDEENWRYVYGMYTADGKQIFADKYTELYHLTDGKYRLNDGEHYGIMSKSGTTVIPFNYVDMRVHTLYFIELYDGTYYSIVDVNNNTIVGASSEEINLFKSEAYYSLGDALDQARREAPQYDGYSKNVYPICYKTAEGYKTAYIDYTTGKSDGEVAHRASNINADGQFVYRAENGLYGFAKLSGGTEPVKPEPQPEPTLPTAFTDVPANAYFVEPVKWAVDRKITNGTSATEFSPNDTCTTAQILTFLYRSQGEPAVSSENPFSDVKETDYFCKAAIWAYENGLVEGGTFGGSTPCTRMSTVTYLYKLSGEPVPTTENKFTDVDSPAVTWAVEAGVTTGTSDTTFTPEQTCTRGQIVTFLYRYAQ